MFLKNSGQEVAIISSAGMKTQPTLGYVDVGIIGKPKHVCRVRETNLVKSLKECSTARGDV